MFPVITRIEDVLPAIEGRDDFIHVVKDGYQVIDYVFESTDSFDDPIRRECRGLKFDLDGNLIARPLHKFFNYGQKLITYDWSQPHQIMTKLDGSMVHTALINGEIRLCTRMGITDQALEAEKLLTDDHRNRLKKTKTPVTLIFEFTSPDNRIVIEYDKPQLTLLAVRHNEHGGYLARSSLIGLAAAMNIPLVEVHDIRLGDDNIEEIREKTTGIEGYVVSWADGTRVKIKTDEYTQMHRAVSYFDRENMILPVVLDRQCDDLYPALSEDRANKLRDYEDDVMNEFFNYVRNVKDAYYSYIENEFPTRKEYAVWVNASVEQGLRAAYFAAIDDKDIEEAVKKCIIRNPDLLNTRWK